MAEVTGSIRPPRMVDVLSSAVRRIGFDPARSLVAVQFAEGDAVYGYPNLTDDEVRGLLRVLEHHASLGHYVATVIKPNHDHEHFRF